MNPGYNYHARLVKVVDGDTVDLEVDLGFYVYKRVRFRLARIDAPEVRGEHKEAGKRAKSAVIEVLELADDDLWVESEKTGKYGRWIGEISFKAADGFTANLSDYLVDNGYAVFKDY